MEDDGVIIFKSMAKNNTNRFPEIVRAVSEMYSVHFGTIYQIGWWHQYGVCVETGDCYLLSNNQKSRINYHDCL